ncbi:M28 family peptidase [Shewanella schlegeliana]|uniref:M28 family peptidase n=2 Tax=Shewanella schlegeliana TaxID=190308 RepID=A0ABS1T466_9GAMM|nr:M28 family peptidase [Shewanella schlegeliana]MBL4915578.1 M28 family peptidase [Shewanella schlegeliana]MCL1111855.1 M28 family peptidase [Shewanella schlegeliana]GIU37607.1 peptidase M28 [Shewanella schlegeliana]
MLRLLIITTALLGSSLLTSCASHPNCDKKPPIYWADVTTITADLHALSSARLQGRKTGTEGAALTREFLQQRFEQVGLLPWQDQYRHPFSYRRSFRDRVGINMVGMLPAEQETQSWRVIIAHYDHLGGSDRRYYPGADDNASGIAGLLQLAQFAKDQGSKVNLLFVATDAEEPGLYGGYALVDTLKLASTTPNIEQVELVINLDMIGRPDRTGAIYIEGARRFDSFSEMRKSIRQDNQICIRTQQPKAFDGSVISIDFLRASDHYPFHQAGIPWLYFGVPIHRDYHQPTDTADKVDVNFLAAVSESAYQLLKIDSLVLKTPQ